MLINSYWPRSEIMGRSLVTDTGHDSFLFLMENIPLHFSNSFPDDISNQLTTHWVKGAVDSTLTSQITVTFQQGGAGGPALHPVAAHLQVFVTWTSLLLLTLTLSFLPIRELQIAAAKSRLVLMGRRGRCRHRQRIWPGGIFSFPVITNNFQIDSNVWEHSFFLTQLFLPQLINGIKAYTHVLRQVWRVKFQFSVFTYSKCKSV